MIRGLRGMKDEYFGEEKISAFALENALRLPNAFATEWLLTDNRSDFSLGGHRLSSLYRTFKTAPFGLTERYFATFSSLKYSKSTHQGVTAPGAKP